jgi:hypothetical protein
MRTAACLVLALALVGCSARQAYEHNQSVGEQQARCDERRTEAEAAKCRDRYARSYDEYQRELEVWERSAGDIDP